MPTAAKLVAAIAFGLVAWLVSWALVPVFPEKADLGYFFHVNTVAGVLCGWLIMGRLAGEGPVIAVTSGIRTAVVMAFYALLAHASWEMLQRALDKRYDGVMEALVGVISLFGEFGLMLVTAPLAMLLLIGGGVLSAQVTELAARLWR
ncbi:TrgA family protein [Rhodovulum adriaticum]|uniref:Tellurium resistance protein n=1 Tax=Rhodovulum adriaticum TaxID=35804 RepID=A0A4R2NN87_RHOAD|nr:TrgA family protein [Rhodovulum adriaticum]MBK1634432.1 hypothetical protein [Rhodovulum adriaticum]TCP23199.1 hypothetical protein EV656_104172 [Rhodovulum adriaticum]